MLGPDIVWTGPLRSNSVPALLNGVRIYAVGDLHGRSDLLARIVDGINADRKQRPVERAISVFIGDDTDRGPGSRAVVDMLLQCRGITRQFFCAAITKSSCQTFWPNRELSTNDADAHMSWSCTTEMLESHCSLAAQLVDAAGPSTRIASAGRSLR